MLKIKKAVILLVVCCLLFGSLTLSSCNPAGSVTRSGKVVDNVDANESKTKDGGILLDRV